MRKPHHVLYPAVLVAIWVTSVAVSALLAAPSVRFVERTRATLIVRPLVPTSSESLSIDLPFGGQRAGEASLELPWEPVGETISVKVAGSLVAAPSGSEHGVDVQTEVRLPGGQVVRASRVFGFTEGRAGLFEIYREADRTITLALEVQSDVETIVSQTVQVGRPVSFKVEVQRVDSGKAVSLETNRMNTFVGEAVEYSFRLGSHAEADAVALRLRPTRLTGAIAEIEVEISGKLPGEQGLQVAGRKEAWVTSRGAVKAVAFESGEPPSGYRFLVTADF